MCLIVLILMYMHMFAFFFVSVFLCVLKLFGDFLKGVASCLLIVVCFSVCCVSLSSLIIFLF